MSDRPREESGLDLQDVAGIEPAVVDAMSIEQLSESVNALAKRDRRRLQWTCENDLRDDRKVAVSEQRVRAAKFLVALLSESIDAIESLVALRSSRWRYEVHFSLFLFVGDARLLHGPTLDRRILDLLGSYLMTVKTRTALAAWKAADTIASCWSITDARARLEAAAMTGAYVSGRLAALSGLEEILEKQAGAERSRIQAVIRSMCLRDRSARVRRAASFELSGGE